MIVCRCDPKGIVIDGTCAKCGKPEVAVRVARPLPPSETELQRREKIGAYWRNHRRGRADGGKANRAAA